MTLAVLAASPLTAPFSTCDLGMLTGGNAVNRSAPVGRPSRAPSIADAVFFLASIGVTTENLKNLALAPAVLPPLASSVSDSAASLRNAASGHVPFSLLSSAVLRI